MTTDCQPPLRGGCQAWGVVVRCTLLRCTRLQYRTCKTSRGHLASHGLGAHGFSTERARLAGGTSLRSWFQKKCLLPGGYFNFSCKTSGFVLVFSLFLKPRAKRSAPTSLACSVLKPCAPKPILKLRAKRLALHVLC